MDAAQKRTLRSRANRLKSVMSVGKAGVTEEVIAGVRKLLESHELVKIRIVTDEPEEADAMGSELARRVPCELVGRMGRVILLYKAD
jgi:RNA-binding protein